MKEGLPEKKESVPKFKKISLEILLSKLDESNPSYKALAKRLERINEFQEKIRTGFYLKNKDLPELLVNLVDGTDFPARSYPLVDKKLGIIVANPLDHEVLKALLYTYHNRLEPYKDDNFEKDADHYIEEGYGWYFSTMGHMVYNPYKLDKQDKEAFTLFGIKSI